MPITPLPTPAPSRAQTQVDFDAAYAAHIAALPSFVSEANTFLLQAETAAANAVNAPGVTGASTTSLLIGTGSKALTIETGKSFAVGMIVTIYNTPTPTNWMQGNITEFTPSTGAITVNVTSTNGSGTLAAWTVKPVPTTLKGLQTIWVPAGAMLSRTTNGPSSAILELATNKNMIKTLDFDAATQEFAQFEIAMPKSWNEGTITFQPLWTAASGSGGVVWALQAIATSDDDPLDVAFGTEQTSTDTLLLANDCHIAPVSAAITVGGTPVENDRVQFQIKRNVADASDTLAVDARLLGIRLFYTLNADTDA